MDSIHAARIVALFGDAARLLGDTKVTLFEAGPFAWLETAAVMTFDVRALFLVDDPRTKAAAWVPMQRNLDAFRFIVARVRPPLTMDAAPHIIRAHAKLCYDDPLLDEAAVDDLHDPRWYLQTLSAAERALWHVPRVVAGAHGDELVWFVHRFPHMAELNRVTVDARYDVRQDRAPLT